MTNKTKKALSQVALVTGTLGLVLHFLSHWDRFSSEDRAKLDLWGDGFQVVSKLAMVAVALG